MPFKLLIFAVLASIASSAKPFSNRKITIPDDEESRMEDFFLLSADRPSKLTFQPSQRSDHKIEGVIERLNSDASLKSSCTFPAFGFESASYQLKLRSMDDDLEVFQIVKIFEDPRNNSMELFVINTRNCQHTKSEILKGYDYLKNGGSFLVLRPGDSKKFDVFSFGGEKDCGSYICKRVFRVSDKAFGEPSKFTLLNDRRDWAVKFMAGSIDNGYYAVTRKDDAIDVASLAANGDPVKSVNNNTEAKVHLLKISTRNGLFGFCYTVRSHDREVRCIQLDHKMRTQLNLTTNVGYATRDLAVHNLRQGGLLLLTINCSSRNDRCEDHEINVVRLDPIGFHEEFTGFQDPGCAPRWQQQFTFYEDEGRVCLFYACDFRNKSTSGYERVVRSRCF